MSETATITLDNRAIRAEGMQIVFPLAYLTQLVDDRQAKIIEGLRAENVLLAKAVDPIHRRGAWTDHDAWQARTLAERILSTTAHTSANHA